MLEGSCKLLACFGSPWPQVLLVPADQHTNTYACYVWKMSMRLVKQQLAALTRAAAAAPDKPADKKALQQARNRVQKKSLKGKDKKAKQAKQKRKEPTEDEVKQLNLEYFTRTAQPGKATELMVQVTVQHCGSCVIQCCSRPRAGMSIS